MNLNWNIHVIDIYDQVFQLVWAHLQQLYTLLPDIETNQKKCELLLS